MCRAAGAGADPKKESIDDPRINAIRDPDQYRRITFYGKQAGHRKVKV